jgi:hypothetical protein
VAGRSPYAWALALAGEVSPGIANPVPVVRTLMPFSGEVLSGPQVSLRWYATPGAASYRVQVATDAGFSAITNDQIVTSPDTVLPAVAVGIYYWRVQSVSSSGATATFSSINRFSVEPSVPLSALRSTTSQRARRAKRVSTPTLASTAATSATLAVPMISQHKDSRLLLLESDREHGAHAWSVDHGVLDPNDPADNMNCGLASVAMVNRLFGGQLSQDRIGYHLFRDREPGPEWDLSFGPGVSGNHITKALDFALGGSSTVDLHTSPKRDRRRPSDADRFVARRRRTHGRARRI